MTMAVDSRQQSQVPSLPYADNALRYQSAPQFSNPWAQGTSGAAPSSQYAASLAPPTAPLGATSQPSRPPALNLPYAGASTSSAPLGSGSVTPIIGLLEQPNLLGASPGLLPSARPYGSEYSASPSPNTYDPSSASGGYPLSASTSYDFQDYARRGSHPSVTSANLFALAGEMKDRPSSYIDYDRLSDAQSRSSFNEAMEASRNIMHMRDTDITPRANVYGGAGDRSSVSSYGFPSTHSAHSSISGASYAASSYSGYGSVNGDSVTDYSSASESVDFNSRTLPRPSSLIGTNLPPPQSGMMTQFSSKVASGSQKKHKCKICEKRFTRPSSLQTHMYSHTGEKPFACEVEGCGRHFSVVSNLRRHRKVHKSDGDHDDHNSSED